MYRISNEHKPSIRLMNLLIDWLLRILGKIKGVEYAYNLKDYDELMEYVWCKPELTGLPVDFFADDGGSYKMHNHIPLVLEQINMETARHSSELKTKKKATIQFISSQQQEQ